MEPNAGLRVNELGVLKTKTYGLRSHTYIYRKCKREKDRYVNLGKIKKPIEPPGLKTFLANPSDHTSNHAGSKPKAVSFSTSLPMSLFGGLRTGTVCIFSCLAAVI